MKIKIKVLVYLISLMTILYAEEISFKGLTTLASQDLGTNINLDKDIKDYTVQFNIVDHQKKGEVFEFFQIVLFDNDMILKYNKSGDFYYVANKNKNLIIKTLKPIPVPAPVDKLHYYTYQIKNITNEDVQDAMSIFPKVKFKYLKQSDIIAYSCTAYDHKQVQKILRLTDNKVLSKVIKITLFSVRKDRLTEIGTDIHDFSMNIDSSSDNILNSLVNGNPSTFNAGFTFSATIRALSASGVSDIFQEPTIRLTNGKKSSTNAVLNLPYLKTTSSIDSTTNSTIEQYEYKDIGLQINILPKIKNNWVFLELDLVLEELISNDEDRPITQKISYKNSIKVEEGEPILLTGIQKIFKKESQKGIPLLSDIPLIGELFKFTSKNNEEQNINILIEVL